MKRIAIIGIGGSGKSTLAGKLTASTGLPLFHMDQLFWKGNWEAVPEEEYLAEHEKLLQKSEWIIEGYIDAKMADRLKLADTIIYLDYPGWRCAWHLILRRLQYHKKNRPEFPKEALERLEWSFFTMVFTGGERKDIEEAIKMAQPENVKHFYSSKELRKFLKSKF